MRYCKGILFFLVSVFVGLAQSQAIIKIGTGGASGAYYPIGGGICQQLKNTELLGKKVVCLANTTKGSVENLEKLALGEVDFAIVQADMLNDAFKAGNNNLRALFSLHEEFFTIVATEKSAVKTFADLQGKILNAGNEGSASSVGLNRLLDELGTSVNVTHVDSESVESSICSASIDATVFMVGHPNANIRNMMSKCQTKIIGLDDIELNAILNAYPYYEKAIIKTGGYGQPGEVSSFGLRAIFVANTSRSEEEIYQLVDAVFSNIDSFKKSHFALADIVLQTMANSGYTVPLHAGAEKYYREKGYLTQ